MPELGAIFTGREGAEMLLNKTYKNQEIADMFGIKKVTLEKIVANKLWTV
jgi:uncharacterized protein YjcR